MKKIIIILLPLFISLQLFSQGKNSISKPKKDISWHQMLVNPKYKLQDIKKAFYEKWKERGFVQDGEYKIFKRWEYWMEYFVDSTGVFDKHAIEQEYLKYQRRLKSNFYRTTGGNWEQLGPFGFISSYGIGRVNVIAYDPNDNNTIWLGAPAGGLWKSTDRGESWTPYSNDFRMMGISDIAINPNNTDIMYVATGDRDAGDTYSYGVMKSVDGGLTWTQLNLSAGYTLTRILLNPANPNMLVVSSNSGIYKSTDAGNSWIKTLSGVYIKHLEFKPGDFNYIYATDYSYNGENSKFYRSENAGDSFTSISIPEMSSEVGRIAIAVTEAAPEKVFLLAGINKNGWDENDFEGLYISNDNGFSFSKTEVYDSPDLGSQSWYDWTFAVSPDNPQEIFAGGVKLYRSTSGGKFWSRISNWGNPNNNDHFHVDQHYLGFQPGTNNLFAGNDGGAYYSESKGKFWSSLNDYLSITEYYKISSASNTPDLIIGGSQDNGTHLMDDAGWSRVMGGDGMDCLIDYTNSNIIFASYQQGYLRKSINRANNFHDMLNPDITGEKGAWVTPFVMDPVQSNVMYAGFESVWKSIDKGENWDNISGSLNSGSSIRGIAIAPTDNSIIYVYYLDKIFKSTDKGDSWIEVNKPNGNHIRDITISPLDKNKMWAAVNNNVFESNDGGESWTKINGSLPKVPMTSIVAQDNDIESLYLGTYIGVFYKDNTMADWVPFNNGLPPVRIGELEIDKQFGKLRAGSYGRGMWQTNLYDLDTNLPLCTSLTYPISGSKITSSSTLLKWRKIDNAQGYKLIIGTQKNNRDIFDSLDVGNTTFFSWENIEVEGKVYIEIVPYNSYGNASSCFTDYLYVGCVFEDKNTLIQFYKATGGDSWKNKWDTTQCDITKWYGVTTNEEGRVISLDLDGEFDNDHTYFSPGNKLSGQLDTIIGKLKYLKSLFLSNNKISGTIPANIGNLTSLQQLDLSKNNFSGDFPDALSKLEKLQYLNLSDNNFSGNITSSFSKWEQLRELILSKNKFSGKIPSSISSLKSVWNIDLSDNSFSGSIPYQLWFLKSSLYVLDFSKNEISGKLSKQLGNMPHLSYCNMSHNKISGSIPEEIANKNWTILDLSYNDLQGCFPDKLSKLCGQSIDFRENPNLPGKGDFISFCSLSKGMCSKLPECTTGLKFESGTTDSLPYDTPIGWEPVENIKGYYLQLGTTSNGEDILNLTDMGNITTYNAGDLPKNSTIYVNIYPYNKYGKAYSCDEFSFTTSNIRTGIVDDTLNFNRTVILYPNPAKNYFVIKKLNNDIHSLDFEIFNITGKALVSEMVEKNKYAKTIDISGLTPGIYIIKMNIDKTISYKKLIVK